MFGGGTASLLHINRLTIQQYSYLVQIIQWIYLCAIDQYFKVYMRSRTHACVTAQCDLFSLLNRLARLYKHLAQMTIPRLPSILMININHITIAAAPSSLGNRSSAGGIYGCTGRCSPVYPLMIAAGALGRSASSPKA